MGSNEAVQLNFPPTWSHDGGSVAFTLHSDLPERFFFFFFLNHLAKVKKNVDFFLFRTSYLFRKDTADSVRSRAFSFSKATLLHIPHSSHLSERKREKKIIHQHWLPIVDCFAWWKSKVICVHYPEGLLAPKCAWTVIFEIEISPVHDSEALLTSI